MSEDYNPMNPVDYYSWMGEFWYTTVTQGPQAGMDVLRPNYVEHVGTGLGFVPGAGQLGKAYKYKGGLVGHASLYKALSKPGGKIALALQADVKHRKKGVLMMDASRLFARYNTIETAKLTHDGDYDAAAVNWFGPPGALLAYETAKGKLTSNGYPTPTKISPATLHGSTDPLDGVSLVKAAWVTRKDLPKPSKRPKASSKKISKKSKKPSSFTAKQKKAYWRMGLRWCATHQRYDRCNS